MFFELFKHPISKAGMEGIRERTNKAWVLANDRFKVKVEQLMNRQVRAKPGVGDRKSEIYGKMQYQTRPPIDSSSIIQMANEPPCAGPHAGQCGESWRETSSYPIMYFLITISPNI